MILKVDLQYDCCYKKVKKLLCKFPEIGDRIFDEKSNTVMIKVICCDPEKIRCKLCNKGRGSIKSIEIKDPDEPKTVKVPAKSKEVTSPPPTAPELVQNPTPEISYPVQGPLTLPEPVTKPRKPVEPYRMFGSEPTPTCCEQCYGGRAGGPCNYGYGAPPPKLPEPVAKPRKPVEPYPMFGSEPIPTCCEQCYGGRAGGPCNYGYGAPPPIYYDGYFNGRIVGYNGYGPNGPNRICHPGRCADYFSEENPVGCSVM
ncbi:unnamed protein product [Rhodiola kirilowii]